MADPILAPPSPAQVRRELEELILADLLGPAGGSDEEVDESRVTDRYLVGMLAPRRSPVAPELQDELATSQGDSSDEGTVEPGVPPAPTFFPSSFGFTCSVSADTSSLDVTAAWGAYRRQASQLGGEGTARVVWRRESAGGPLNVTLGAVGQVDLGAPDAAYPDVVIRGRLAKLGSDWLVTLFLVNDQEERASRKDEAWLFQAELAVSAGGEPVFVRRRLPDSMIASPDRAEARTLEMAYRDEVEFAVGHGIAVRAEAYPPDPRMATRIVTVVVPRYEVPRTDAPSVTEVPELAGAALDMAVLADARDEDLAALLSPLADAYEAWIGCQQARIADPGARLEGFGAEASDVLGRCRHAAARIRTGITLLGVDPVAARAFRFANRAMWQQRVRSMVAERRRRDAEVGVEDALAAVDVAANRSWRPFQLAFVLLNLPSLTDPKHAERAEGTGLADLLWFPTGGGKTEAYLGLTAYILAVRRLQGVVDGYDGGDGVAVLMRYTLRLLTIQQFQRAAALLCACESIRNDARVTGDESWGPTPFRIGLWVGSSVTPKTTEDSDAWVKQKRGSSSGPPGRMGSPAQLTTCPWCGSPVSPTRDVVVDADRRRTLMFCGDATGVCRFTARNSPGEGLPVVVVDEEIYRLLPAVLLGTVDKFAQMPWQGPVQTLFGRVTGRCPRHGFRSPDLEDSDSHPKKGALDAVKTVAAGPLRPPDLIIQDELHLIAGPLGSLVGLFETVVDELCTWQVGGHRVRPKVIASTATVRRAPQQVHQLFLRQVAQFPPSGLDAGDSFFARQRPTDVAPGRSYLGICAHGRRFKAAQIRVYVAAMGAAQYLWDRYGGNEVVDPYMTLVGYFSALRELGGMRRLVDDDVATRLGKLNQRGLARRRRPIVEELTSRLSSGQIPIVLDKLSLRFEATRAKNAPMPLDVLLATNMVSVGVDVPRLGLMVVAGQPKATAEYIQATSRVGRAAPGLVITVYNWARPRDLSHYERFEHYHATFYRQVEALSVTPFAPRALDRGLSGVLAALVRLSDTTLDANDQARSMRRDSPAVAAAIGVIRRRAEAATSEAAVGDQVRIGLEARLDQWAREAAVVGRTLTYRRRNDGVSVGLLREPDEGRWQLWSCPTSLREVEPGIRLLLQTTDLGESGVPPFAPAAEAALAPVVSASDGNGGRELGE